MSKHIILNGFCCTSVGNQCAGMWRHPRDRTQAYIRLPHWLEFARVLERGKLDAIFIADGLGISDVYKGSGATTIRQGGAGFPRIDPIQTVSAITKAQPGILVKVDFLIMTNATTWVMSTWKSATSFGREVGRKVPAHQLAPTGLQILLVSITSTTKVCTLRCLDATNANLRPSGHH